MLNCIKVTPEGVYEELFLDLSNCDDICNAIGCGFFEIVRTDLLRDAFNDNVVMVIDDNSALNGSKFNPFASLFYSGQIFGNVIFVREVMGDFAPLTNIGLISCWFSGQFGLKHS